MSTTPIPATRCTGCSHKPHRGPCKEDAPGGVCACAIVTLDETHAVLELLAARTEYLVSLVLDGNEHMRQAEAEQRRVRAALEKHLDDEESRFARIEAQVSRLVAKLGNGAVEDGG